MLFLKKRKSKKIPIISCHGMTRNLVQNPICDSPFSYIPVSDLRGTQKETKNKFAKKMENLHPDCPDIKTGTSSGFTGQGDAYKIAKKSIDERISEIEAKENRLKQQKKKLKAEQSKKVRNARTKRQYEVGAILEKSLGVEFKTPEQRQKLIQILTEEVPLENGEISTWAKIMHDEMLCQESKAQG